MSFFQAHEKNSPTKTKFTLLYFSHFLTSTTILNLKPKLKNNKKKPTKPTISCPRGIDVDRNSFISFNVCWKPFFTAARRRQHLNKIITNNPYVTVCLARELSRIITIFNNFHPPRMNNL